MLWLNLSLISLAIYFLITDKPKQTGWQLITKPFGNAVRQVKGKDFFGRDWTRLFTDQGVLRVGGVYPTLHQGELMVLLLHRGGNRELCTARKINDAPACLPVMDDPAAGDNGDVLSEVKPAVVYSAGTAIRLVTTNEILFERQFVVTTKSTYLVNGVFGRVYKNASMVLEVRDGGRTQFLCNTFELQRQCFEIIESNANIPVTDVLKP